ncbi:MAG: hypothetical protein ACLQIQ_03000 [Beijerinckiaceae bacterium]
MNESRRISGDTHAAFTVVSQFEFPHRLESRHLAGPFGKSAAPPIADISHRNFATFKSLKYRGRKRVAKVLDAVEKLAITSIFRPLRSSALVGSKVLVFLIPPDLRPGGCS